MIILRFTMIGYKNITFIFIFFSLFIPELWATDLHVGSGQTYSTIQGAVNVAVAGDSIIIHAGTYTDSVTLGDCGSGNYYGGDIAKTAAFCLKSSGTLGNPITMRNNTGDTVTIDGESIRDFNGYGVSKQYWVFNGLIFKDAMTTSLFYLGGAATALTVQNCTFQGTALNPNDHCIEFYGSNSVINNNIFSAGGAFVSIDTMDASSTTINNNTITVGTSGYGIYLHSDTANSIVEKNIIIGNTNATAGIFFRDSNNITVRNNVIRGNFVYYGILYQDLGLITSGCKIYNNSILCTHANMEGIKEVETWAETTNNIINDCNVGIRGIQDTSLPPNQPLTNDIYSCNYKYYDNADAAEVWPVGTGNITTDPLYVSSTDLHITSSSPAKDGGTTLSGFTNDRDGITRPQGSAWDMGAYEYVQGNIYGISLSGGNMR